MSIAPARSWISILAHGSVAYSGAVESVSQSIQVEKEEVFFHPRQSGPSSSQPIYSTNVDGCFSENLCLCQLMTHASPAKSRPNQTHNDCRPSQTIQRLDAHKIFILHKFPALVFGAIDHVTKQDESLSQAWSGGASGWAVSQVCVT